MSTIISMNYTYEQEYNGKTEKSFGYESIRVAINKTEIMIEGVKCKRVYKWNYVETGVFKLFKSP